MAINESDALQTFQRLVDKVLPDILRQQSGNLRYGFVDSISENGNRVTVRGYNQSELIENMRYIAATDTTPAVGSPCLYISTDPSIRSVAYAFIFNDNTTQTTGLDGWTPVTEQWNFGSSLVALAQGQDYRWKYALGDPVKVLQGSTVSYFNILGVSYNPTNTETAIELRAGTDYRLMNQTLESVSYSKYVKPNNFPSHFNYTPTLTNFNLNNGTATGEYYIHGQRLFGNAYVAAGTSTSFGTNGVIDIPISANAKYSTRRFSPVGNMSFLDSGTNVYQGRLTIDSTSPTTMALWAMDSSATYVTRTLTASTIPFTMANGDVLAFTYAYEI